MSIINSFDKNQNLAELTTPLFAGGNPVPVTPAQRQLAARTNLGLSSASLDLAVQPVVGQPTPAAVNASATMTTANLLAGVITSTTAAAVAATLPLVATWDPAALAAYPGLANGDGFDIYVVNTGASNAFTMTTNTGWTLVGNMAVALSTSGHFRAVRTSPAAWVLYRIS